MSVTSELREYFGKSKGIFTDHVLEIADRIDAEVERLLEENQSIGMAAYEVGYKDASAHYELDHCPACQNIADLQEALEESAKLREFLQDLADHIKSDDGFGIDCGWVLDRLRELGVEVDDGTE